ncbi:hypothetical protein NDU88_002298 [Pleurodeles waltl]|uniref:Uncharacterized protein n=1 Tax=Pleurodeles waltl TaxID=8319 RepID=A0AAV7VAS5_PLEWA|nr:hypothetical protein NDU88_002298 [Pleurodeles waltl]
MAGLRGLVVQEEMLGKYMIMYSPVGAGYVRSIPRVLFLSCRDFSPLRNEWDEGYRTRSNEDYLDIYQWRALHRGDRDPFTDQQGGAVAVPLMPVVHPSESQGR